MTDALKRLLKLDLSNFQEGDRIVFCPDCEFQDKVNRRSLANCKCHCHLETIRVTDILIGYIKSTKVKDIYEQALRNIVLNDNRDFQKAVAEDALILGSEVTYDV